MQKGSFRPDVEGMRAVAILLVIAAHAGVPGLAGGFVGVDVFFVLSGFLITGLLVREVSTTGTVSFRRFYARRIRRLMPAMVLMLVLCSALGAVILPLSEHGQQAEGAAAAAAWVSNLYFTFANVSYFDPSSEGNLFLHTWSLGVEEQFYLIWPVVILLAMSGKADCASKVVRLRWVMGVMLVAGLAACIVTSYYQPRFSFYMMPTRAWQFAAGGLLALLSFRSSAAVGWAGMALVFVSSVMIEPSFMYPGALAILPTLGTVLVLSSRGGVRFLDSRPMQIVGGASYSWYLWHWPALILGAALFPAANGSAVAAGAVAVSLGAAFISLHVVETPLRRAEWLVARPARAMYGAALCSIVVAMASLSWMNTALSQRSEMDLKLQTNFQVIYARGCDDWYHSSDVVPCKFGRPSAPHTAVLMGDSIGAQWAPAFIDIFGSGDWQLIVLTKSSCPMVDAPFFYQRLGRDYAECGKWRNDALAYLSGIKPDVLVLGSSDTYTFSQEEWRAGSSRVLDRASLSSGRVYLMQATPRLPFHGPSCLLKGRGSCTATGESSGAVARSLALVAENFPNVRVLNMNDVVCPEGICTAHRDGIVTYRDSQHLTASFVMSLRGTLQTRLAMPR